MSRRIRVLLTFALALAAGSIGLAVAQDGEGESVDVSDEESTLEVQRRANLSPEEQRTEGEEIVEKGNQISRQVSAMLDQARQERDIIRVTCLNDKLTQINANLRTAETRLEALSDAVAAQDGPRRNHEFTVLTVIAQKLLTLEREAQQCIGEDIFETGATSVETTIDPGTPETNPDVVPVPPDSAPIPFLPPPIS